MPLMTVKVKQNGFRRLGKAWNDSTDIDTDDYSQSELKVLQDDPMFVLAEVVPASGLTDDDPIIEALVSAMGSLDKETEGHFTKKGIPELKTLETITGVKVSAKERDAAFKLFMQLDAE